MSREIDEEGLLSGFEQKSFYDAPTLALSRLLEGNLQWDTWKKTFFEQSALSPQERTAYTDRIKKALGGSPVTDALVNIASNPFVWFTFLTTPAGATALKQGGRIFSSALSKSGKDFVGWAANNQSIMRTFGLLGLDTILMNTYVGPLLNWMGTKRANLMEQIGESLVQPSREYLEALGKKYGVKIDRLEPELVKNRAARAQMESDQRILAAWLEGLGQATQKAGVSPQRLVRVKLPGRPKRVLMELDQAEELNTILKEVSNGRKAWNDALKEINEFNIYGKSKTSGKMISAKLDGNEIKLTGKGETATFSAKDVDEVAFKGHDYEQYALFGNGKTDALEGELKRRGLWNMAQAARRSQEEWVVKLYGDEEVWAATRTFKVDRYKAMKHFSQAAVDRTKNPRVMEELLSGVSEFDDAVWFGADGMGRQTFTDLFRKGGRFAGRRAEFEQAMVDSLQRRYSAVGRGGPVPIGSSTTDFVNKAGQVVDDLDPLRASGSANPMNPQGMRTEKAVNRSVDVSWHIDDIEALVSDLQHLGVNQRKLDLIRKKAQDAGGLLGSNEFRRVKRLNFTRGMHSFAHRSANQYMFNVMPVSDDAFNLFEEMLDHPIGAAGQGVRSQRSGLSMGIPKTNDRMGYPFTEADATVPDLQSMSSSGAVSRVGEILETAPPGGYSVSDFLDMGIKGLEKSNKADIAEFLAHVAIPRIRGEMPVRNMITMQAIVSARKAARTVANSRVGQHLKNTSDLGRRTMEWLADYGSRPVRFQDAASFLHGSAGLLYSSHMGLNVPTLILNLTQPFLNAGTWLGYRNVLASYKDAFEAMGRYSKWRLTTKSFRLPIATRRAKIRELLDPDGLLQLSDDMLDTLDRPFETAAVHGKFKTALDITLKGFEKSEWVNRLVTYNALRRSFEKFHGPMNGWSGEIARKFRTDAGHVLAQTQFTSTMMSTPLLFQGLSPVAGGYFSNPLTRMFLTFPTRTITSLTSTAPNIAHGRRELMGREFNLGSAAGLFDLTRMVGAGAVIYEAGKAVNLDLSRGLAPYTQVDSLGLGDLSYGRDIPLLGLPPFLDIPKEALVGLYEGDRDAIRDAAYRLVPGGIGLRRMFEAIPSVPGVGGLLQKRYADWGNIQPDGSVPIRDATGRTIEAPSALETVMRGIGFDFTKLGGRSSLMDYMSKNQEAYKQAKWQALRAMRAGNMTESLSIQNGFRQKTGIPLKVTQSDLEKFVQSADMTSPERFYGTLNRDLKGSLFPQPAMPSTPSPEA